MALNQLVKSPGDTYLRAVLEGLESAVTFNMVTGFATVAGLDLIEDAIKKVLDRGGTGRERLLAGAATGRAAGALGAP